MLLHHTRAAIDFRLQVTDVNAKSVALAQRGCDGGHGYPFSNSAERSRSTVRTAFARSSRASSSVGAVAAAVKVARRSFAPSTDGVFSLLSNTTSPLSSPRSNSSASCSGVIRRPKTLIWIHLRSEYLRLHGASGAFRRLSWPWLVPSRTFASEPSRGEHHRHNVVQAKTAR